MRSIVVNVSEECLERLKVAARKSHRTIEFEAAARLEQSLGVRPHAVLLSPRPKGEESTSSVQRTVADLVENYASRVSSGGSSSEQ